MENRPFRNRRGIAIELALSMMVIVFSLCAMMTTVVTVSRKQSNTATSRFVQAAEVDALGEAFAKNPSGFSYSGTDYVCDTSIENKLTVSKNGKVLLIVELEQNGETYSVKSWQH